MVCLIKTKECVNGEHEQCNGGEKIPAGNFGGSTCVCPCHDKCCHDKAGNEVCEECDKERIPRTFLNQKEISSA